ncbi:MAG: ribonuclease [Clostridia bacterium]|nr:ribonuclease [Clostridia bacterium]
MLGCSDIADTEITDYTPPSDTTGFIEESLDDTTEKESDSTLALDENGSYYSRDEVASYINIYAKLPSNFITKSEARELGWEGGSVERYLEGAAIGGDVFGNREGLLPRADGRTYYECDIDTNGKDSRGAKRIVYSNDGLIYYTDDHYESFTLLYGEK